MMMNSSAEQEMKIDFYATTNAPKPYDIWWKVRNVGEYAERNNKVCGEIIKNSGSHRREDSQFGGPHFVECYVIKNGECVAMKRVPVNIGVNKYCLPSQPKPLQNCGQAESSTGNLKNFVITKVWNCQADNFRI